MEIFLLVLGIVVGWIVGRLHLTLQIIKNTQNILNNPLETLLKTEKPEASILYTTLSDKYVYLYDKKTEKFLCQAATLEETVDKAYNLDIIESVAIVEHNKSLVLVHKGIIVDESIDES